MAEITLIEKHFDKDSKVLRSDIRRAVSWCSIYKLTTGDLFPVCFSTDHAGLFDEHYDVRNKRTGEISPRKVRSVQREYHETLRRWYDVDEAMGFINALPLDFESGPERLEMMIHAEPLFHPTLFLRPDSFNGSLRVNLKSKPKRKEFPMIRCKKDHDHQVYQVLPRTGCTLKEIARGRGDTRFLHTSSNNYPLCDNVYVTSNKRR